MTTISYEQLCGLVSVHPRLPSWAREPFYIRNLETHLIVLCREIALVVPSENVTGVTDQTVIPRAVVGKLNRWFDASSILAEIERDARNKFLLEDLYQDPLANYSPVPDLGTWMPRREFLPCTECNREGTIGGGVLCSFCTEGSQYDHGHSGCRICRGGRHNQHKLYEQPYIAELDREVCYICNATGYDPQNAYYIAFRANTPSLFVDTFRSLHAMGATVNKVLPSAGRIPQYDQMLWLNLSRTLPSNPTMLTTIHPDEQIQLRSRIGELHQELVQHLAALEAAPTAPLPTPPFAG